MSQPSQRDPAFLRRKDVQIRTGLARSTIYLYIHGASEWRGSLRSAALQEGVELVTDELRQPGTCSLFGLTAEDPPCLRLAITTRRCAQSGHAIQAIQADADRSSAASGRVQGV